MKKKLIQSLYYLFIIHYSLFSACKSGNERHQQPVNTDSIKERLINVNKVMVDNESARIADFIKRHAWKMDSTKTGVRYWIVNEGKGALPKANDKVKINYRLFLLDGTLAYESEKDKPLEFTLGRGESTAGLEEGLMKMHSGSKAWLIVPKYLGYGMTGDGKKIPGNSTLLYDVELKEVISNK